MPLSDSRKKANSSWDKKNMKTYTVHLRTAQAEEFKAIAEKSGTTPAALLKNFVLEYIQQHSSDTETE